MYRMNSDYTEGCLKAVLNKLIETNMDQTNGYGEDPYTYEAKELVKKTFACPDALVQFLIGGTQANFVLICSALRPHQAVIATNLSHIATHEAGAIEHTGHKVLEQPSDDGKLTAEQVEAAYQTYALDPNRPHWAQPKLVYVSQPTETGSLYSKKELNDIYKVCQEHGLYLYVDGARLAYAFGSEENDLAIEDLAKTCDAFYAGGTKCGLLFGEAMVIINDKLKEDFFSIAKQNGGILAKGRLLGVQFGEVFRDGLYFEIGKKACSQAARIRKAIEERGIKLVTYTPTNQIFIDITKEQYEKLSTEFALSHTGYLPNGNYSVRICTSWATKDEEVEKIIQMIKEL
ncbi:MAG: aminotransferase class I/II-fold pyridoxal phosphate-dependent enzyme [Phascolarctobacterium sp.]|nr:aminotransferase class I/II-fold pyridoxal phosphate-dependent enzyme [Phascolarctobacterium sp.]